MIFLGLTKPPRILECVSSLTPVAERETGDPE
jgi:hypothetical protein